VQHIASLAVPVPLYTDILAYETHENADNGDTFLSFETILSIQELETFYRTSMELYGWQQIKQFKTNQCYVVHYEMPHRLCSLFFQPQANRYQVQVFVGLKD